jgi:hypothetical protein
LQTIAESLPGNSWTANLFAEPVAGPEEHKILYSRNRFLDEKPLLIKNPLKATFNFGAKIQQHTEIILAVQTKIIRPFEADY